MVVYRATLCQDATVQQNERLLTTTEVAQLLGWHYRKVQRLAASGALQSEHKLPGPNGARLFKRAVVLRYAAEQAEAVAS